MLDDFELDTLARAVAALGDEDAGRLKQAVLACREKASGPRPLMVEWTTDADGTMQIRTPRTRDADLPQVVSPCV